MNEKQECGIIVSSVTYAVYGRQALERRGLRAFTERLDPARSGDCGCGYGLRVRGDCRTAAKLLEEEKITVKGFYEPL